jgi:hypothetical protein
MEVQQLLLVKIPKSQKKTMYNIAQKARVKISIHTVGNAAFLLIVLNKSLINCNLLCLPEKLHGVYRFFDELRKRKIEYRLDVYTHDYQESQRRNAKGVFGIVQTNLPGMGPR